MSATTGSPRATLAWRDRYALYFALLVSWVAMLGSLYFSEVRHYIPCQFCWYQRILMYPIALLLPIGLLKRDETLPWYTVAFSALGMGVASYHYLLQKTTWFSAGTSCAAGVPCNLAYINWFGFITIPFLALTAFTLIFLASLVVLTGRSWLWEEEERAPWLPVAAIITVVSLLFLPSFLGAQPAEVESLSPVVTPLAGEAALAEGATLYAEACAACHGADGAGMAGAGTALSASAAGAWEGTEEEWVELVRAGIPADHPDNVTGIAMPPSGGRPDLTDDEMRAIFAFLQAQ